MWLDNVGINVSSEFHTEVGSGCIKLAKLLKSHFQASQQDFFSKGHKIKATLPEIKVILVSGEAK